MRILSLIIAFAFAGQVRAADLARAEAKSADAAHVLASFVNIPEQAIPRSLMKRATCVAVIPDIIKASFIIGGRGGWGLASCRTPAGWSHPVFTDFGGMSAGLQIGFQSVDLVLVFTHPNAATMLSQSNFQLALGAGLAVGPVGRDAAAGTDFQYGSGIYVYSRAEGLFVGVNIDGSMLSPLTSYNSMFYPGIAPYDVLTGHALTPNTSLQGFVGVLANYAP